MGRVVMPEMGFTTYRLATKRLRKLMAGKITTTYSAAGVDTDREEEALRRLVSQVRQTWPKNAGRGAVELPIGYFANVISLEGNLGLAISADGVGTKVL